MVQRPEDGRGASYNTSRACGWCRKKQEEGGSRNRGGEVTPASLEMDKSSEKRTPGLKTHLLKQSNRHMFSFHQQKVKIGSPYQAREGREPP